MVFEHDYKKYPELTNSEIEEFGWESPHPQITEDFKATVVKVHDGDTITVSTSFRDFNFPIRLLDIDAPEMNAGGEVARDWLREQIQNEEVEIQINKANRVGKYGRLLGYVVHGGLNINELELALGLAVPFGQKGEGELPRVDKIFNIKQWL
jgi:endonuclease YncB( thermonuclease family)